MPYNSPQHETWLRPNPRAVWPSVGVLGFMLLLALGLVLFCWAKQLGTFWTAPAVVGLSVLLSAFVVLLYWSRLPRLACDGQHLLVYLEGVQPCRVPLDLVECFFRGQSEAGLPGAKAGEAKTAAIVVRLAERATDWQQRDVRHALGHWCGGYITILGTWCEPITADLLGDLNARLTAAHRALRAAASGTPVKQEPASKEQAHKEPAHGAAIGQRT